MSRSLVMIAILTLVFAACFAVNISAQQDEGYISARKIAPGGGNTIFTITIGAYWGSNEYLLVDGEETNPPTIPTSEYLGEHYVQETNIPLGWTLQHISCKIISQSSTPSTYEIDLANSRVIIQYNDPDDIVECTFTNIKSPVGGVVVPKNSLEILTPYIALAGLVAAISAIFVIKKRK